MAKRPEAIDCVDVKRRAQRKLAKALAGKTPAEQVATLRRLAAQNPLWQRMAKTTPATKTTRSSRKRRSTG